ncbi:MAG: hypothetical protein ABSD28_05765 [Tepidisphaeraceae bacterium]
MFPKPSALSWHVRFGISLAFLLAGCEQRPPSSAQSPNSHAAIAPSNPQTAPGIVEIANNFSALANPSLPATKMSFHGVMLGSPESAALALPHAQEFQKRGYAEIECDDLHVDFEIRDGLVKSIYLTDPSLENALNIHELQDVQMRFGKADEADVNPANPLSANESGQYIYFGRHLIIDIWPDARPHGPFVTFSVTLIQ